MINNSNRAWFDLLRRDETVPTALEHIVPKHYSAVFARPVPAGEFDTVDEVLSHFVRTLIAKKLPVLSLFDILTCVSRDGNAEFGYKNWLLLSKEHLPNFNYEGATYSKPASTPLYLYNLPPTHYQSFKHE